MNLTALFSQVLTRSLTGSIVILFVLLVRLLLRRAPKIFSYVLWAVVLIRLLCPALFTSRVSPVPDAASLSLVSQIQSITREASDSALAPVADSTVSDGTAKVAEETGTDRPSVTSVLALIWVIGIAVMLVWSLVSLIRLRRSLVGAGKIRDNIYMVDHLQTPFVFGLFHPKIYLPSGLPEREQHYIILHEQTHIRRLDHCIKILAFCTLAIHWFNPLVWLAFALSTQDMELSCDEAVMRKLGCNPQSDFRGEYCASILQFTTGRRIFAGTPLAFGEGNPKRRLKNVLSYRKPGFWVILLALAACVITGFCLVGEQTSHADDENDTLEAAVSEAVLARNAELYALGECAAEGHKILDRETDGDTVTVYALVTYGQYGFMNGCFVKTGGSGVIPTVLTFLQEDGNYQTTGYREPQDGIDYMESLKELFPAALWDACFSANEEYDALKAQEQVYAQAYLDSIGRDAKICEFADLDYAMLTDFGVSAQVADAVLLDTMGDSYPYWIGSLEQLEQGVRYVYTTGFDLETQVISFVKTVYDTGDVVEAFYFDAQTGFACSKPG